MSNNPQRLLKVVVAPDSYKGSLSSIRAADAIETISALEEAMQRSEELLIQAAENATRLFLAGCYGTSRVGLLRG